MGKRNGIAVDAARGNPKVSEAVGAHAMLRYLAVRKLGHSVAAVAGALGVTQEAFSKAVANGSQILANTQEAILLARCWAARSAGSNVF